MKTPEQVEEHARRQLREEIESLERIKKELEEGKEIEEIEEMKEPLAITSGYHITIELSTGGPADGFILYYSEHKELVDGVYYWADWGVYREVPLRNEEIELVEQVYLGGDVGVFLPSLPS